MALLLREAREGSDSPFQKIPCTEGGDKVQGGVDPRFVGAKMTARGMTGFYAFFPPGNLAIFSRFWADFLTNLHRKPGEKGKSTGEFSKRHPSRDVQPQKS